MPLNTDFPDYLARQLPDQQSNAQLNQQVSANLLHGMQNKQRQRDQDQQDRQISQRDRQIDLQERDQALQEMLAPIQYQSFQNKLKLQSIEIADAIRMEKERVESREAASVLAGYTSRALKAGIGGSPKALAGAYDILKRYPAAFEHPEVKSLLGQLAAARQLQVLQDKEEANAELRIQLESMRQEGQTERTVFGGTQRHETAIEVQKLRNLSRIDPATGQVLTESKFVDKHMNQLMRNEGIGEVESVRRLKAVYHLESLGPTPPTEFPASAAPVPDASNALMDAFKAWIENKKKQ